MTLQHLEGFDAMLLADLQVCYTVLGGSDALVAGVVEGNALQLPNGGGIEFAWASNAEVYFGAHIWPSGAGGTTPNNAALIQIREGSTVHGLLGVNSDGTITISRNSSIPATSANVGPFLLNVPHFFEVYYKCDNSAGAWEVRLDGVTIIGPTGSLDTNNAGAVGTINNIRFLGGTQYTCVVDNVYIGSGSSPGFLGQGRCVTDLPTADGTNLSWTASAGTDVSCVDDATPNNDTDYISSSTAGHIDTFTMATLGVTGAIKAVAVRLFGRKDDVAARTVNAHIRRASTEYDNATTHALTTTMAGYQGLWETDPNTGVAWVDSDIDGAEYGVKNV